ncbi:MAG: LURP-one-related family protein [Chloroflexota bacterium]
MRYVIKQKVLALAEKFNIRDEEGNKVYQVKGKLISLGDKLSLSDMSGNEIAKIKQELISITPSYRIYRNETLQADVEKKLIKFFKDNFKVKMKDGSEDIKISGSILEHEYTFRRNRKVIGRVTKAWVSIGDRYGIEINQNEDDVLLLACVIIVDMIVHAAKKKNEKGKGKKKK